MRYIVESEDDQSHTETDHNKIEDPTEIVVDRTQSKLMRRTVQELMHASPEASDGSDGDPIRHTPDRIRMLTLAREDLTQFVRTLGDCPFRLGPITALATLVNSTHVDVQPRPLINLTDLINVLRANGQQYAEHTVICVPCEHHTVQFIIKPMSKPKVGKRPNVFFNQLTLVHRILGRPGKYSVKLFSNGRIHMTGICSYPEMFELTDALTKLLNSLRDQLDGPPAQPFHIVNHTIVMINGNYKWGKTVELRRLCDVFNSVKHNQGRWHASYNPEVYPGINARYTRCDSICLTQCSVFVFGSGSVVISGGKTIGDLRDVYVHLETVIKPFYESGLSPSSDSEETSL